MEINRTKSSHLLMLGIKMADGSKQSDTSKWDEEERSRHHDIHTYVTEYVYTMYNVQHHYKQIKQANQRRIRRASEREGEGVWE